MEFPKVNSDSVFDGVTVVASIASGMLGDHLHAEGAIGPAVASYANFAGCMALVCVRLARKESIAEDIDNRGEV